MGSRGSSSLVWNFPIDVTYRSYNVFGWPQLVRAGWSAGARTGWTSYGAASP